MTLGGTNTYSGATTINNGTISFVNPGIFGASTVALNGTVGSTATLQMTAGAAVVLPNNITLSNTASAAGVNFIDVPDPNGGLSLGLGNTVSGGSAGNIALVKTGAGIWGSVQSAVNTVTWNSLIGDTRVANGTLRSSSNTAGSNTFAGTGTVLLGDTSGSNNATLILGGTANTFANKITVVAGNTGVASILFHNSGTSFTCSGALTLNHDVFIAETSGSTVALSDTFFGAISGAGNLTFTNTTTNSGAFALSLIASNTGNTYSGNWTFLNNNATAAANINFNPTGANTGTSSANLYFAAGSLGASMLTLGASQSFRDHQFAHSRCRCHQRRLHSHPRQQRNGQWLPFRGYFECHDY